MAEQTITPIPGAVKIDTGNATASQANKMQDNANLMAKYGAGNYTISPTGDVLPKSSQVGIVTSNKSKTDYNNNISTLNNANNAIKNSVTNPNGVISMINGDGKTVYKQPDGTYSYNPKGDSKTTTTDNTTGSIKDSSGNSYNIPEGTDPVIAQTLINNLDAAKADITTYQAQINSLTNYDVNTDPAAVATAKNIKDSFDILIKQMQDKNTMLMGSITANSARNGSMQYTNEMDGMFKNAEFDAGIQRISSLQQKENDAISRSNAAYASRNVKALATATADYEKAKADGRNALLDFQKTISDQIKANNDRAKQDVADLKATQTADITNSKAIAQLALDQITASGVTDEAQIDAFLQDVADNNGISNPEILKGQIATLDPQYGTAALKNANIKSTIAKRNQPKVPASAKPKVDGGLTYTQNDVASGISFLNKGGTAPDGNNYGGKGSTYVNTGTYVALYNNWIDNQGTPQGFIKNYPVKSYVNPADYSSLPANIQPKATAGTTGFTVTK